MPRSLTRQLLAAAWLAVSMAGLAGAQPAAAPDSRPAPTMLTLATGSTVATWRLPATGPARRTPLVFLHGGPGMYTEARRLAQGEVFRSAGFETVFFDQVGGGLSARLPVAAYTLQRQIDDLEALRSALGAEQLLLWGNSWGAQLALLYAQQQPARVAGLVLTSPGIFPGARFKRDYSGTNRGEVDIPDALARAVSAIDSHAARAEQRTSQAEAGRLFDTLVQAELMGAMVCKHSEAANDPLPGGANIYVNRLVQREVAAARPDWARLPPVPALVVRGACDYIEPASAARYGQILQAEQVTIPGAGHALLEQPEALRQALAAFIQQRLAALP